MSSLSLQEFKQELDGLLPGIWKPDSYMGRKQDEEISKF